MKKLFAGGVILAVALTGAPQAAAFSSGSSGSNVIQPTPTPEPTPVRNPQEVVDSLSFAYDVHFMKRGYVLSQPSNEMAQMYHQGNAGTKAYIRSEVEKIGYEIIVESFPASTYEQKVEELINVPEVAKHWKFVGGYIESDYYTVTTTFVIEK